MPTVEINLTGGTYIHKSLPLSAQVTRNFWPQLQEDNSTKSPYVLDSWVGQKSFATVTGNTDRGMLEHQGVLYKVSGTTLYTVASDGTETSRGTIPGAGRCIMEGIGSSVVIVTGGVAYEWNGTTLTTASDPDFETPNSCAHLNNQMLYDGDGGRFASSDVGTPLTINALNYATAESNADDLLRVYTFDQLVYLMGEKTIETWWNSGVGNPPFDRVEQGIMQVGLDAIHSVANDDDHIYWLGDDLIVYAAQGAVKEPISPHAINREIEGFSTTDDAVGWCMNLRGQWFYCITFPVAEKTFVYPKGGEWFEWSSGTEGKRSTANSYAFVYGKHLVGDYTSGDIFELDFDTYTDNGSTIIRQRDTGPLHGGLFGSPGKRIEMNRFELIMETGTGLLTGQGSDPVVMLQFSDDGGKTFQTEMWGRSGKMGEYTGFWKVEWFVLGSFESRIIRIKTSDPVYYSIHSAAADIEIGI